MYIKVHESIHVHMTVENKWFPITKLNTPEVQEEYN